MKKTDKYAFAPDDYYKNLYAARPAPFDNLTDKKIVRDKCREIRDGVKEILGINNIPLKVKTLNPVILKTENRKNYTVLTLRTEICEGLYMLSYILKPDAPLKSGIVAVCGHGYGCRQIIRQSKNGRYRTVNFFDNYQKNFAEALAQNGHTVIVPEPVGFGEARLKKDFIKPFYAASCDTVSHHSLLYGFSTAALRVYQVQCCMDILEQNYGMKAFGCMGISGGGLVTLYASLCDERIIKACVCGYINRFGSSVLSMWHCPDNYIPGLLTIGDMYDFAAALAPKKLMMEFGTKDKLFPIEGSRTARDKIAAVFSASGVPERFMPVEFDGKHEVYLPSALTFFDEES